MNSKSIVTSIVSNEDYGVCYEPVVSLKDMNIIGYEALSRFKYKSKLISPIEVFSCVHDDAELFFLLESIMKKFQIKNRPHDKTLFLNLDPDVTTDSKHMKFWINELKKQKNIIVEIVENSDEENAKDVEIFMKEMDNNKISYAYDDYAKPNSMFFASLLHQASVIKLDIDFLRTISINEAYIEVAKGIVNYAKKTGKKTVLEGVEGQKELQIAQKLDVDYIQGYMFKKDFITKWKRSI
ncbi:MAG: EAL domain-containing protein [Campylobacterota bacterium]|nr:EAL domain-containing protein [Campylobacterota bacterium]